MADQEMPPESNGPVSSSTDQSELSASYPPPRVAWGMVGMLTFGYILSFVDRNILGLLVEPIKADLELTDTQIGLLLGPAFAIFYATMGLPFGYLADKKRRTWIIGFGVALWSAATVLSGFAKNFIQMFIARMSVGVGEATLGPCAMSMIADSFPEEQRAKPIAVYSTAASVGGAVASLVGAAVLTWAKSGEVMSVPLVGELKAWQFSFIIVGVPGLFLSLLFFLMREPPRRIYTNVAEASSVSIGDTLKYIASRWVMLGGFVLVVCYMTIVSYSHGWFPAMFERTWGWSAEKYALFNAAMLLLFAPLTINIAGWLADKWVAKGRYDVPIKITFFGAVIVLPTGVALPLMPSPELAFVFYSISTIGVAMMTAVAVTALLYIVPSAMRGQIVALYYMSISICGLMLGPTSVGLLSDYVFGPDGLRYAAALPPLIFGVPTIALMPFVYRKYMSEIAAMKNDRSS
jgi:MFS family permease